MGFLRIGIGLITLLLLSFSSLAQVVEFNTGSQEGDESAGILTATVQLDAMAASAIDIAFTISGTAIEGVLDDFTVTSSPLTIPAGELSADIEITVNDDAELESDETVILTLVSTSQGSLGSVTEHTATIADNDVNNAPVVTITAPPDGHMVVEGTEINFTATATDVEDDDVTLTGNIDWTSDLETGSIGSGGSFSTSSLSAGTHTITASVTDSNGEPGSDNITVTVSTNNAPGVTITAPSDGHMVVEGTEINFTATATDVEDDDVTLTGNIDWTSDLETGSIGSGGSFSTSSLSAGTHTITASVTDSNGEPGSNNITVTVNVNNAPVVTITAPPDGLTVLEGTSISFTGTATDTEDGTISGNLSWTSSINGSIGSGGSFNTSVLSVGTHTITASVTDSNLEAGSDDITVTVNANNAPVVTITAPPDDHTVLEGTSISFTGTATDTEDGTISGNLSWTSSIDGIIGSGGSFSTSSLSVGTHTITASVTDSNLEPGSDNITVTVNANNAPMVTITLPPEGHTVEQGTSIMFAATAEDTEEGDLSPGLNWIASLDGGIGTGPSISTAALSVGTQSITASVMDGAGLEGSDAVTVTVTAPNVAPVLTILLPLNGHTVEEGTNITFTGTAIDLEDLIISHNIVWSSNFDGELGIGASINVNNLSVNTHTITASITDSDSETSTATRTVTVTAANTAPTATAVSISGTEEVGFTLNGIYTYNDADGDTESGTTFRWLRNGNPISGATSQNYTLMGADEGTNIIFEVTPGAATGVTPGSAVQSSAVGPILPANTAPTATGVSISGNSEVGFTLTGSYTYNDADGDTESGTTFRWLRNNTAIGGATGQNYTLVSADQGTNIRFEVTPAAASGVSPGNAVQSPEVGPIAPANTAPTATAVSISGTEEVGFTLNGSYTYNDADGDTESGTTFRWLRNNTAIGGATGQNYTLVSADQGANIRFEVTPAAASGVSPGSAVQSPEVGPIAPANTAPTATAVSISGTTIEGQTLTGQYTYNDADLDQEGTSTFRWFRGATVISGATNINYTLVAADISANIAFEVTPVALTGVSPGSPVTSPSVGPIVAANAPPTNITLSSSSVPENQPINTIVGTLSTTDADNPGDSHTYSLVPGAGSADNGSFNINNNQLRTSQVFNFEVDNSYSIRVQTEDAAGATFSKQITIGVTNVNDLPVAADDINNATSGTASISINVAANDTDEDGNVVPGSVTLVDLPTIGTAVNNNNGTVTYTPNGTNGMDNFTYTIQDNQGATSLPGTVVITVGPNNAPVANDDLSNATLEDVALNINVIANDTDSDGSIDPASISITTDPLKGSATANNNGTVTYTPNPDENGPDEFSYSVTDNLGAPSNSARVVISINPVNDPPVANNDNRATDEETSVVIEVLDNDVDIDGTLDVSTVTIVTGPGNGTAVENAEGTITYTPADGFNGNDSFSYNVRDNQNALSNDATVTISVSNVNDPPLAVDDPVNPTTEEVPITFNVVANDSDPDGNVVPGSVALVDLPANGTALNNNDGTVTYTPNTDYNGSDSFTYTVLDDMGALSNIATVSIQVAAVNDPPIAMDDPNNSTNEDTPLVINVTGNDSDPDGSLDLASITASDPTSGTVTSNNDGTVTYTPDQDFNGSDSFVYTISDNGGAISNEAEVLITVNDINDPPVATNDVEVTDEDQPVTVNLVANDIDVDGDLVIPSLELVTGPTNGDLVNNANGSVTYTPDLNFNGQDSFTYTIDDDDGATSNTGTVSITVNDINDAPVANNDAVNTDEDVGATINVVLNDTDADGTIVPGSITIVSNPANGSVTVMANGTIDYDPEQNFNGLDTFTYTVQDNDGAQSNIATVTVSVNDINDPVVAMNDVANTDEETTVIIDILANDGDPDNPIDPASVTLLTEPVNGEAVLNSDGTVAYTPDALFNGMDSFTYNVQNTDGQVSNIATVTVNVNDVNNLPTAKDDSVRVNEDEVSVLNILENDEDPDGILAVTGINIVTAPVNGTIEIVGQELRYTPMQDFTGIDNFTYTVTDDDGGISNEATVAITIRNVNDPPTDLILSRTFVDEDTPPQTVIGTFSTVDIDTAESFTYSLVAGNGSEDNGAFSIFEDQLISQVTFDQAQKDEYYIRVKTDDGDSSLEEIFVITIYSDQNPIGIDPVSLPELHPVTNPSETYIISVEDVVEIQRVLFRYRGLTSDRTFGSTEELTSTDREYQSEIVADAFDEMGIQYEFVVENTDGGTFNLVGYTYNQYQGDGLDFENLVFGQLQADYNLLSIPLRLDNGQVPAVFEELGIYDQTLWRLFSYQNGNYIEYTDGLNQLQRGRGYWLIMKDQANLDTGPGDTRLFNDEPFNLQLDQGWNLIGNPYGFTVSWLDVRRFNESVSSGVQTEVYIFDGTYVPSGLIEPFQGAFVFSDEEVELAVPLLMDPTIQSGRRGSTYHVNDENNWEVGLSLSSANFEDRLGGLGMREDADNSKDQYDRVRLPRFIKYLDVNFPKPEYFAPEFSKDIVPTSNEHIWEFTVETNINDAEIKLEWSEVTVGDYGMELWLYHKDREVIINMQQVQHYDFSNQGTHNFAVYYGNSEFISSELHPGEAVLAATYPNPFTDNLTVLFSLPEKTDSDYIRLSVYDLMGRKIKNIWENEFKPGFYQVDWDGTNSSGDRIAAGTYLIRLDVNGQETLYKRVIKK